MSTLQPAIDHAGSATKLAALIGVTVQRLLNWTERGVPEDMCPAIERATAGAVQCEKLRADVKWARVPDADWPGGRGRPCIDVAAPKSPSTEIA